MNRVSRVIQYVPRGLGYLRPSLNLTTMDQLAKYLPNALRYAWRYWKLAVILAVVSTLVTLVSLLLPWPMKILIDNVLGDHPLSSRLANPLGSLAEDRFALLLIVVAAQLGITLVMNGLGVISSYVNTKLQLGMNLDFRSDLFQHANTSLWLTTTGVAPAC